jgi:hypothetical protein
MLLAKHWVPTNNLQDNRGALLTLPLSERLKRIFFWQDEAGNGHQSLRIQLSHVFPGFGTGRSSLHWHY